MLNLDRTPAPGTGSSRTSAPESVDVISLLFEFEGGWANASPTPRSAPWRPSPTSSSACSWRRRPARDHVARRRVGHRPRRGERWAAIRIALARCLAGETHVEPIPARLGRAELRSRAWAPLGAAAGRSALLGRAEPQRLDASSRWRSRRRRRRSRAPASRSPSPTRSGARTACASGSPCAGIFMGTGAAVSSACSPTAGTSVSPRRVATARAGWLACAGGRRGPPPPRQAPSPSSW